MPILTDFFRWLPTYFFPRVCVGCGKEGWTVCPTCRPTVARVLDEPRCPACGRPAAKGITHPLCRAPLGLDGLTNFYRYDGWATSIMRGAKFENPPRFRPLDDLTVEFAEALRDRDDLWETSPVFVPVPLHWWRKVRRGYDQAARVCVHLAEKLGMPMDSGVVVRSRYTLPQTLTLAKRGRSGWLSHKELKEKMRTRRANIRDSFMLRRGAVPPHRILLVDDVWTTGATMTECCKLLKRHGATWVWGITLFRA